MEDEQATTGNISHGYPASEVDIGRRGSPVIISHPITGVRVRRLDFIHDAFGDGFTRDEIRRQIGVSYQTVFQSTEGMVQGEKYDATVVKKRIAERTMKKLKVVTQTSDTD